MPAPWTKGYLKLFISHLATHKEQVGYVAGNLRRYGIKGFVAHTSITPSAVWQDVIETALDTCDAMVAFLHKGFKQSDWCDQEIGFAVARQVPLLPLHFDLIPYGFIGKLQAQNCHSDDTPEVIAKRILRWLMTTPAAQDAMAEGLVSRFERAESFRHTREIYGLLNEMSSFTGWQLQRLSGATQNNDQISQTVVGTESMSSLIQKLILEYR